jgi:hypothetical protein
LKSDCLVAHEAVYGRHGVAILVSEHKLAAMRQEFNAPWRLAEPQSDRPFNQYTRTFNDIDVRCAACHRGQRIRTITRFHAGCSRTVTRAVKGRPGAPTAAARESAAAAAARKTRLNKRSNCGF